MRLRRYRGHKRPLAAAARKLALILHALRRDGSEFRFGHAPPECPDSRFRRNARLPPRPKANSGAQGDEVTVDLPHLPKLFSERAAAEALGISIDTLRRERKRARIAHIMIGSRIR
jgi:hypothetical protein